MTIFIFTLGVTLGAYFMTPLENTGQELGTVVRSVTRDQSSISVLFLGDLMLDRHVALKMDLYGQEYPFEDIKEFLKSADFVIANAEGVFSSNISALCESISLQASWPQLST